MHILPKPSQADAGCGPGLEPVILALKTSWTLRALGLNMYAMVAECSQRPAMFEKTLVISHSIETGITSQMVDAVKISGRPTIRVSISPGLSTAHTVSTLREIAAHLEGAETNQLDSSQSEGVAA